ncbi:MAG TPA: cation diffusion facilitator family transporter [Candidatus Baltobacteraceae bacterium]|nr:cation diffusion facilitator family transporter [Candidatus Baltobacteraceae bacterium]
MPSRRRLALALMLAAAVAVLEFWGGIAAHSLALTTDAVHVCMDVFALAIALFAAIGATRPANRRKTFGYGRIEVLGALFNGALLFGATLVLVYAAIRRFGAPIEPHGATMTIVAAIGFVANVTIGLTLAHDHSRNLNVRAALFHVVGDALGALAVIVGGAIILFTHQAWIDPLLSLFVAGIIIVGVVRVLRDAADVLLESTPPDIDSADVERRIGDIDGVAGVHDLHVWAIGSDSRALSAHVLLDDRRISEGAKVLARLRDVVLERYAINHVTVQLEAEHCDPGGIVICRPET